MVDVDTGGPPNNVFDKGPNQALARHFAAVPGYDAVDGDLFWWDWGPIFYRGRLDRSARLLAIASDPGPTERVVGRTLVGDAGQRVQGLLTKIGLNRSYALTNAFCWAVHPSKGSAAVRLLRQPDHLDWRNHLFDVITGTRLQAIIAFGVNAQAALRLWDTAPDVPTFELPHPSSHDTAALLAKWNAALPGLREAVTADAGGSPDGPGYGSTMTEADYSPIPPRDLPFGLPHWMGDDHWGRTATPPHNNTVRRTPSDTDHSLTWQAPTSDEPDP